MTTSAVPVGIPGRRRVRAATVLAASLVTLAVWAIAVPIAGVDLLVHSGGSATETEVGPAAVVIVTLLAGLAAWGLLAVLERVTPRARTIWTAIAVAVLVISLAGPLSGVTAGAKLSLAALHLAAGAFLIPLLARTAGPRR